MSGSTQNLDAQVPLDLPLRDESGKAVAIGDYSARAGRPDPGLLPLARCSARGAHTLLRSLNAPVARRRQGFDVDHGEHRPKETPDLAARKKAHYLARYGRPGAEGGGIPHGDEARRPPGPGSSGSVMPTTRRAASTPTRPDHGADAAGQLSRYVYGLSYPARDLQLSLMDAAMRRIGSAIDQLLLLCYHYDPRTGSTTSRS